MMAWVVLDSNVYVSALVFGGNPRTILEIAELGLYEICLSEPIMAEVKRVLSLKFSWPEKRISEAIDYLWTLTEYTKPQLSVTDCSDPDDNRVLECALEARAQMIVTGDNHLLKLHPYNQIPILTPKQFLEAKLWQK